MTDPVRHTIPGAAGTPLSVTIRGQGQPLLFSHGTGFACACFEPFLDFLAGTFQVFAADLSGHGASAGSEPHATTHDHLAADVAAAAAFARQEAGGAVPFGVFHSISAVAALRVELANSGTFRRLVLYEPPLARDGAEEALSQADQAVMAARAAKRRDRFENPAALAQRFAGRPGQPGLDPAAAQILAEGLLVHDGDNYRLACAPAVEADLYATNHHFGIWPQLHHVGPKALIMCGHGPGAGDYPAATAPLIAAAGGLDLIRLRGLGHLGFIEKPRLTAGLAAAYLAAAPDASAGETVTPGP